MAFPSWPPKEIAWFMSWKLKKTRGFVSSFLDSWDIPVPNCYSKFSVISSTCDDVAGACYYQQVNAG